ncbi:MAG: DNA-3-methyladenine glycosylase [Gemmatimonadales bacterium]
MIKNKALLPPSFYARDTIGVARGLLGCILATRVRGVVTAGRIVETEAYVGPHDPAAHSYGNRKTARNAPMFGPPGIAYVYFIYGMHWCVNAVTEGDGHPSAVLIRAIEPVMGEEAMRRRRRGRADYVGPGKVCQALGITGTMSGVPLDGIRIGVWKGARGGAGARRIEVTPRIGIREARDWPLRFVLRA